MFAAVVVALLLGGCPRPVASSGVAATSSSAAAAAAAADPPDTPDTPEPPGGLPIKGVNPTAVGGPAPAPAVTVSSSVPRAVGATTTTATATTTATTNTTRKFAPVCFCAIPEFRARCLAHAAAACADAANATVRLTAASCAEAAAVGRCSLTVSKPELKAR